MAISTNQLRMVKTSHVSEPVNGSLTWWEEFKEALFNGGHCLGLTFNTDDYVFTPDAPPRPLLAHLCDYFEEQRYDLIVTYSISRGIEIYDQTQEKESLFRRYSGLMLPPSDETDPHLYSPSVVLRGLDNLLRQDTIRAASILTYGHDIAPAAQTGKGGSLTEDQLSCIEMMHAWSLDNFLNTRTYNAVVALLREGYYHNMVSEYWKVIRLDLPSTEDIERFYTFLFGLHAQGRQEFARLDPHTSLAQATRASSGLRLRMVEEMSRHASARKESISLSLIKEYKAKEINRLCGNLLDLSDDGVIFDDLAGLESSKGFCRRITHQVRRASRSIPRAFLLVGPPGCGKSSMVRALANELGWNCLVTQTARLIEAGESERNLERIFNIVEAFMPCLLFIDDLDRMLVQRGQGSDAGVCERLLSRLREFISLEHLRGGLIVIGATNRPDLLTRSCLDFFRMVIPILQPTAGEMAAILPKAADIIGRSFESRVELKRIAQVLRQKELSPRQALDVISMAALRCDQSSEIEGRISEPALFEAAQNFRNNYPHWQTEMTSLQAIRLTTSGELLPWSTNPDEYEFPDYLQSLMDDEHNIDLLALDRRLDELSRHLSLVKTVG